MISELIIAEKFGIGSLRQLRVFLQHAKRSLSIAEVTTSDPTSKKYKEHYGIVRKLMKGEPQRIDSLELLRFESNLKGSKVMLTAKGESLVSELDNPADYLYNKL